MKSRPKSSSRRQAVRRTSASPPCAAIVAALSAYVDGEVDERMNARVESHLPRCPRCSRALTALVLTVDTMARVRGRRRAVAIEQSFRRFAGIVARVAKRRRGKRVAAPVAARGTRKVSPQRAPAAAPRSARTPRARRRGSRSK